MKLHYLPFSKYDSVVENNDGTILNRPHDKKRYIYSAQNNIGEIFIYNSLNGWIMQYDLETETYSDFVDSKNSVLKNLIGLGIANNEFYLFDHYERAFVIFNMHSFAETGKIIFEKAINSFCIIDSVIYAINSEEALLYIIRLENRSIQSVEQFAIKGIGESSVRYFDNQIWISDSEENLIRVYDNSGKIQWQAITPFIDPLGLLFKDNAIYVIYGGLVNETGYGNNCWQEQKPFAHQLNINIVNKINSVLTKTNTFNIDFFYEFHQIKPLPGKHLPLRIQIALPPETEHQMTNDVSPLSIPYKKVNYNGVTFAEFLIDNENINRIGYKANMNLTSVKETYRDDAPLRLANQCYLNKEELEYLAYEDTYFDFLELRQEATLQTALEARNLIYQSLHYKKNNYAISFKEILQDGYGTCGDYTSLLLIAFTRNHITCQSASGYKIPRFYNNMGGIISAYYDHAWVEVYDNSNTPHTIESSTDGKQLNNRYSEGQFMGIDWTHIKLYQGKAFPNLIVFPDNLELHPFDFFEEKVFFRINCEMV